jgi:hypothetical protein
MSWWCWHQAASRRPAVATGHHKALRVSAAPEGYLHVACFLSLSCTDDVIGSLDVA